MAKARPQAIYIGPPSVYEVLKKARVDWDFIANVPNIATLWNGLTEGTISNNIQVIFIQDQFFDPQGEDRSFEKLVATMGAYCFIGIINYDESLRHSMKERISFEADSIGEGANLLYYFITRTNFRKTLDASLNAYINNSNSQEVVAILSGRISSEERQQKLEERQAESAPAVDLVKDDRPNPYLGQVVAVTSSKGGSGKSTVAVSLATFLTHSSENSVKEGKEERPLKVIILDLDVRDGQLGFLTGNSTPTVIQLRLSGIDEESIKSTVIHSPGLKCDILLAPRRPRMSDDTPPEFYVELIQNLRRMYDYIILDTSVNYLDPLLEKVAYPTADQIIFVTDIVVNSVFSMTRWIQEVTKTKESGGMGISKNKIGIVVNKSLANVNMPGEKIQRSALGQPVITVIPSNPKIIAHAANLQSMEVILKHKDLYPAIRKLAMGIVGKKYALSNNVA